MRAENMHQQRQLTVQPGGAEPMIQGAPWCYFADWQKLGQEANLRQVKGEALRLLLERAGIINDEPPHVVGLTCGGRNNPVILLDTKLGIIHWHECLYEIILAPARELLQGDACDYAPENEAEEFRKLHFIPKNPRWVVDIYTTFPDMAIPVMQDIYRRHGWPDLQRYRSHTQTGADKDRRPGQHSEPGHPWVCATKNMTECFGMPKPTSTLLDAIYAYVDEQLEPCLSTATGRDKLSCSVAESQWCSFSTDEPPGASAAYSSYASAAASWWSA
ncbi:hypothetical protein DL764_009060 [Monosporascus ibericus]|uniref:DUF7735 domain-containing protein n=1 Tax=Monosporascus ibericus TaxID=155417 RepID=A0A4Q4SW02_9PEZI|nr:hypothetical protein DL764_009060 [Monosporascus ibericus]